AALGDHPSIMPPEGSTACRKRPDTQRTAVTVIDAWTREDVPELAWYRARGFAESEHYLHVYKTWGGERSGRGLGEPRSPLRPGCGVLPREARGRGRSARTVLARLRLPTLQPIRPRVVTLVRG